LRLEGALPLGAYFDTVERQRVLPVENAGGLVFSTQPDFDFWEHAAIPAVALASRRLEGRKAVLVLGTRAVDGACDEAYRAGLFEEVTVSRRAVFSLGVARLGSGVATVGLVTHRIVLPRGSWGDVLSQDSGDSFVPGWCDVEVDWGDGPTPAAWQLREALDDPAPDDDGPQNYEGPPDVEIVALTAEFLTRLKAIP
jgi:hypothetical protein